MEEKTNKLIEELDKELDMLEKLIEELELENKKSLDKLKDKVDYLNNLISENN